MTGVWGTDTPARKRVLLSILVALI